MTRSYFIGTMYTKIEADATRHNDVYPPHQVLASKLWIVPVRLDDEDVWERVTFGGFGAELPRRAHVVGVGPLQEPLFDSQRYPWTLTVRVA